MRQLSINETNMISGGISPQVVTMGVLAGLVALWAISTPRRYCYNAVSTYDVIEPVYDFNGYYIGDMINTYEKVDYVCV